MTTKRLINYRKIYDSIDGRRTLQHCYKNPSYRKQEIYRNCCDIVSECDEQFIATAGKILTYNTHIFTFGFYVYTSDKEYFVVITPNGIHSIQTL